MGGSLVGGGGVSPGGTGLSNTKNGSNTQSESSPQAVVDTRAKGVQGFHDLSLDKGVLASKGKNVKLLSSDHYAATLKAYCCLGGRCLSDPRSRLTTLAPEPGT